VRRENDIIDGAEIHRALIYQIAPDFDRTPPELMPHQMRFRNQA
jgi:hypothetical protein